MESSTFHKGAGPNVSAEFGAWPIEGSALENANQIRTAFDTLLTTISPMIVKGNERYLALVKTKLEEGCFYAVKGVAKPAGNA